MRCLVTGGAGFIGSHLVTALHASHDVIVLDNLSTGLKSNVPKGVTFRQGHAGDSVMLDEVLPGCECIFHLAAVSSVQASLDHPISVNDDNLNATLNLLEAAKKHKVKRFVFSSSASIYGDTNGVPAHEDMTPNPMSHYAVQKIASEYYCRVYARVHGLETVSLRYFNIFGLRQRSDSPYSGVIAKYIEAVRAGRFLTIYGDGSQTRDFCGVADVVSANIAAAFHSADKIAGKVFNIGSGKSVSIIDLLNTISDIFPAMPQPIYTAARAGEIQHSRADISLATTILGYQPAVSFKTGIRDLASTLK